VLIGQLDHDRLQGTSWTTLRESDLHNRSP
jgi:hypothetical protein